jgi:hypothetical protein
MSGIIGKNANRSSGVIGTAAGGIASLAADSSPQLGGFLDVNGNYIQMEKGGDISSASPTVIDTDGDFFVVTGTTNFSAFTVAADRHFFLEFAAVLTMTHGNGTLDLPGAANITTAASDVGEFVSTAANVVTCVNYTKRDGTAVALADNSITLAKMAGGTDGNIISYDASGDPVAIATGDDGQVLTSTGAGSPPAFEAAAGGITEADTWRLTTNFTGDVAPISSNLERDDARGHGLLGTGMTVSSGIFTFPSTGFWLVTGQAMVSYNGDSAYNVLKISVTTDNSSYDWAAQSGTLTQSTNSGSGYGHASSEKILNVTSTTDVKVRFDVDVNVSSVTIHGNTDYNLTYFKFIKLAAL